MKMRLSTEWVEPLRKVDWASVLVLPSTFLSISPQTPLSYFFTHLGLPRRAAWWRELNPLLLVRVMSAAWSSSRVRMSSRFLDTASCRGVSPSWSCTERNTHLSELFLNKNMSLWTLFLWSLLIFQQVHFHPPLQQPYLLTNSLKTMFDPNTERGLTSLTSIWKANLSFK